METGCIYGLLDPLTYEIMYVGQSVDVKHRMYYHKCLSGRKTCTAIYLTVLHEMGLLEKLDYVVLEDGISKCDLNEREWYWISLIKKTSPLLLNHEGNLPSIRLKKDKHVFIRQVLMKYGCTELSFVSKVPYNEVVRISKRGKGNPIYVQSLFKAAVHISMHDTKVNFLTILKSAA